MTFEIHGDWDTPGFDMEPLAGHTGPFPRRPFLRAWSERMAHGEVAIVEDEGGLLAFHVHEGVVEFAGEPDLTDYHSPLGSTVPEVLSAYASRHAAMYDLDSLPAEAAEAVEKGFALVGVPTTTEQHETAAVLRLGRSWDEVMDALGRKQRHEMRRKRRRFEEILGSPVLERRAGPDAVADFAELHRGSDGRKATFMTRDVEAFFVDLESEAGGVVDVLVAEGRPVAAAFGFEDEDVYYLYNSAYDSAVADASPGIVLVEMLMRRAVAAGRDRLDFLKGDEEYKLRLGARLRPLYRVKADTT